MARIEPELAGKGLAEHVGRRVSQPVLEPRRGTGGLERERPPGGLAGRDLGELDRAPRTPRLREGPFPYGASLERERPAAPDLPDGPPLRALGRGHRQIGRASCRERV